MYLNTESIFYIAKTVHSLLMTNSQIVIVFTFEIHSQFFHKPYTLMSAILQNAGDRAKENTQNEYNRNMDFKA